MTINPAWYVFWLFGWDVTEVVAIVKVSASHIRCRLGGSELIIDEPGNPLRIPLNKIEECEKVTVHQGRYSASRENIRIILKPDFKISRGGITRNELFLAPMNVYSFSTLTSDIDDFITVLESLIHNRELSIHPNPYYRELQRLNRLADFSEQKWDAYKPPYVYTKPVSIFKLIGALIVFLFLGLLIWGLIMMFFWLFG